MTRCYQGAVCLTQTAAMFLSVCLSVCHIKEMQSVTDEEERSDTPHPPHYAAHRQRGSDGGDKETTNDQGPFELEPGPISRLFFFFSFWHRHLSRRSQRSENREKAIRNEGRVLVSCINVRTSGGSSTSSWSLQRLLTCRIWAHMLTPYLTFKPYFT